MKYKHYIEAPNEVVYGHSLFLAGGITGCYNWQEEAIKYLLATPDEKGLGAIYNPRRANFDINNPNSAEEQITWEYNNLKSADAILFWFAEETIQPIVLFELGRWSYAYPKQIFVGVHPNYPRRQDVEIQMGLVRPYTTIHHNLKDLCNEVLEERSEEFT